MILPEEEFEGLCARFAVSCGDVRKLGSFGALDVALVDVLDETVEVGVAGPSTASRL